MMLDDTSSNKTPIKATVYYTGEFGGFQKIEGHLYNHGRTKYAQYNNAAFVHIKPKRKRKIWGITQGYNPTLFIVEGWGHPEIRDVGSVTSSTPDATITDYGMMFGDTRKSIFNQFIDKISRTTDVLGDYREVK